MRDANGTWPRPLRALLALAAIQALSSVGQSQSPSRIRNWIQQLAIPEQRAAASLALLRAGPLSAAPLASELSKDWVAAADQQRGIARNLALQILFDLEENAADAREGVVRLLLENERPPNKGGLYMLLGRLASYAGRCDWSKLEQSEQGSLNRLAESLHEHASWLRSTAALGITEWVREPRWDMTQQFAIDYLARKGRSLFSGEPATREEVETALIERIGGFKPISDPFDGNHLDRWTAARALASLGSRYPAAATGHIANFASVNPVRRTAAVRALAEFENLPTWAISAIVARLEDPDLRVAYEAVSTLGIVVWQTPECIDALYHACHHPDPGMRRRAETVLDPIRKRGSLPSTGIWWWPDGATAMQGPLRNELREGIWMSYWGRGGIRARGEYRAGAEHGLWMYWYEGRKPSAEGSFINGKRVGEWTTWYFNGGLATEGSYTDGLAHGPWQAWHENGNLAWTGKYRQGKRHGAWIFRYDSKELLARGEYEDGLRIGEWKLYDKRGDPLPEGADVPGLLGERDKR